ncbi:hypothetical protein [Paracoccus sp. (in: a-proteobacteria)]|uniref:hypothetical protein n=1 Tax=Paracoccus sp. TaxID=267 RepID=UPI002AFF1472|nr:hypothetical protein [Paracoccus sp. (in: a-proteobacteria)]
MLDHRVGYFLVAGFRFLDYPVDPGLNIGNDNANGREFSFLAPQNIDQPLNAGKLFVQKRIG